MNGSPTSPAAAMPTNAAPAPQSDSLGENKSVSCSTNPAFGANSCDQCFDGGSVTVGKKINRTF